MNRTDITNEMQALKTVAADVYAKLMDSRDANESRALSARLAELHERHAELMERLQRQERVA